MTPELIDLLSEALRYVVIGGLTSAVTYMKVSAKKKQERESNVELGMQCLLRESIIRIHKECMRQGYCSIAQKESLSRIYRVYHALGGNDVATALYDECMELPESPPDRKE